MLRPSSNESEPSQLNWLGGLPKDWNCQRLKFCLATALAYGANEAAEEANPDDPRFIRITDLAEDGSLRPDTFRSISPKLAKPYLLTDGDILLARSGATVGKSFLYRSTMGHAAYAGYLIRARLGADLNPRFLHYYLQSDIYWKWIQSIFIQATIQNVSADKYANLLVPLPPLPHQEALVSFLNRETARIEALVAKKQQLLDLLEEKLQSAITSAITKSSGRATRLRYHVGLLPGYAFSSTEFSNDVDDVRLLRGINVSTNGIRWEQTVYWPRDDASSYEYFQLQEGDIVFGMDRPWIGAGIRVALIGPRDLPCLLLQRVARLRAHTGLLAGYLELLLRSKHFYAHFEPELTGVSVPHISGDQILSYAFKLPTSDQQECAVNFVREIKNKIDGLSFVIREAIDRLLEYRAALITNAVTGLIDVRDLECREAAA